MHELSLISTLGIAGLLGMHHALDADHIAAVAALSGGRNGLRRALRSGLSWGIGHGIAIGLVGGMLVAFRSTVPDWLAQGLEIVVGTMLIFLGIAAVVAAVASRLHSHAHEHDGEVHSHLHFHPLPHREGTPHRHPHLFRPALRPLLVGGVHGLAGSGAVVVLILTTIPTVMAGCLYLGLFGLGTIAGMAAMSLVLGAPLAVIRRRGTWMHRLIRAAAGLASVSVGLGLLVRIVTVGIIH